MLGALLGDEVKYHLGACPAGEVSDCLHLAAVGDHGVLRAELLGELERIRVAVDHDDPRRGQRGQALDADVAEAASADDHAGRARV